MAALLRIFATFVLIAFGACGCTKKAADSSQPPQSTPPATKATAKWEDPDSGKSYPYCTSKAEDIEEGFGTEGGVACVTQQYAKAVSGIADDESDEESAADEFGEGE